MEAEVLGAWGDFIGGIAVVAGLVFVGIQLLGANKETRAATIQASLQMQIKVDSEIATHAETWHKVINNIPIDDEAELRKAIILTNLIMTVQANRYHQYKAGYLDKNSWDACLTAISKSISNQIYPLWRNSAGAANHSSEFLGLVDDLAEKYQRTTQESPTESLD